MKGAGMFNRVSHCHSFSPSFYYQLCRGLWGWGPVPGWHFRNTTLCFLNVTRFLQLTSSGLRGSAAKERTEIILSLHSWPLADDSESSSWVERFLFFLTWNIKDSVISPSVPEGVLLWHRSITAPSRIFQTPDKGKSIMLLVVDCIWLKGSCNFNSFSIIVKWGVYQVSRNEAHNMP